MPLIDTHCAACDRVTEVYRPLSMWPKTPTCANCGGETEQVLLPSYMNGHAVDPVVVYQAPDGTFRFPPDTTTASTAMYDKQGMTRIELRGFADVRRFEKHMNKQEWSAVQRRVERQQESFEAGESARRSEIRRGLDQGFEVQEKDEGGRPTGRTKRIHLSGRGRAIMQAAIDMNDRKGGPRGHEPGFRVEAYSENRSNRDQDPHRRGQ